MSIIIILLYPKEIALFLLILILLPIFLITNTIVSHEKPSLLIAQGQEGQEGQNNASATDMENLRKRIIPEAEEVNEANSELIKICTDSPNARCDDTMIIIYNDCIAYPAFVAAHIPSCGDSKLFSYLVARELLG
jgi:hypothetical protein